MGEEKVYEILVRLDVRPNVLEFQDVWTYTSKHPGILGCLDIHLNVLGHVDISQTSKRTL